MANTKSPLSVEELADGVHDLSAKERERFEQLLDELDGFTVDGDALAEGRRDIAEGRWVSIDQLKAEFAER